MALMTACLLLLAALHSLGSLIRNPRLRLSDEPADLHRR